MGMRRRTRRRAIVAGAAIAHHEDRVNAEANDYQDQPQYAPPPPPPPPQDDPADEVEHLAQLHDSGVLTDDEFAAAKAKALGI